MTEVQQPMVDRMETRLNSYVGFDTITKQIEAKLCTLEGLQTAQTALREARRSSPKAFEQDLGARPTIHAALPLLGVNRYWRKLTIRKLVKEFSKTQLDELYFDPDTGSPMPLYSAGRYLTIYPCCICHGDGARETDDPRFTTTLEFALSFNDSKTITLLLTDFDPSTMMCTFKPAQEELKIIFYDIACDENGEEYCDFPRSFSIVSNAWFRPTEKEGGGLYGFELAGRPHRFPLCGAPGFCPQVVEPNDIKTGKIRIDAHDEKLGHWEGLGSDWTASWHTIRTSILGDDEPMFRRYSRDVEVVLVVHEVKVPFLDLFCPRRTSAEKDYYDDKYGSFEL
ncbi:hypothetical protein BCR35DRAFT_336052 [Leucosporidium creatinivorum]|uniref:Uncharacterized protein n=1 Tax=Leucosporidium creatinivorum TaxID=106004 RepID=A0A1Y2CT38_9BASI|nr:hypothetical protein BCR35DRAFT_336052 [Leucosporidium creatinivorum]